MKVGFKSNFFLLSILSVIIGVLTVLSPSALFSANAQTISTITEFPIPMVDPINHSNPYDITAGPDGNLWYTHSGATKIGRITPNGTITEFPISLPSYNITGGSDGNVWFTITGGGKIARITPDGTITEFPIPPGHIRSEPHDITTGPDGNLWFTNSTFFEDKIGRMTPNGEFAEFPLPSGGTGPYNITTGPDGNLWFTEWYGNKIGRVTLDGTITEFPLPFSDSNPHNITTGSDGNLWFTETGANKVGRITPDGTITEFSIPTSNSRPFGIATGSDGNVWFVEWDGNKIGRITPNGLITEFSIPTNNSVPYAIAAGSDDNLWFTEVQGNKIGRVNLSNLLTPTPSPTSTLSPTPTLPPGTLNVPLLKQGIAPFTDNNPSWEGTEYDHGTKQTLWCGTTIADCGCAMTSMAMILRYYGIVNPVDGAITTPTTVNDYFNRNTQCGSGGCVSLGYSFGDVRWAAVGDYAAEAHSNYGTQKIIYDGGGAYNATTLAQDINDGRPVILGVPGHWVVGTGITDNTFAINDPLFTRTHLNDPAYGNTASQGMRRYKKTNSDFSSIEVAVKAPAQVIITDPHGKKTGYDSTAATIVQEIPNSNYFFDEAYHDGTGERPAPPANAGVHWAIVQTPIAGKYQIEVIGSANQEYSFAVYGSDRDAEVDFKLFEGELSSNVPAQYSFDYNPEPHETTIALQVPIDIKPLDKTNTINPKSNGVIPVAILSTRTFDATKVNPKSVKFGPNGASARQGRGVKADVNGDRKQDFLFVFETDKTGIKSGDTKACLTGEMNDKTNIQGCDTVKTVSYATIDIPLLLVSLLGSLVNR